jgi:hypothetical protein
VTDPLAPEWWRTLPPAETEIDCGTGRHVIRWQDGSLTLPAHPDTEAELVLATLGGEQATCVEVAGFWRRHASDLDALTLGPRFAADEVLITWDDVEAARDERFGPRTRARSVPMRRPSGARPGVNPSGHTPVDASQAAARAQAERIAASQLDLLSLLALGPALQMRLAATAAAGWRDRAVGAHQPVLTAALTGRFAPVARDWLGVDPGRVTAYPHEGPGWGGLELTGSGAGPSLRADLPVDWLARVWAAGLAVAGGHLVVAVLAARWPEAQVLALPEPGADPVTLDVRASVGAGAEQSGDGAHWEVTDTGGRLAGT